MPPSASTRQGESGRREREGAIKPKEIAASQSGSRERELLESLLLPAATSVMLCLLFKHTFSKKGSLGMLLST